MKAWAAHAVEERSRLVMEAADVGDEARNLLIVETPPEGRHPRRLASPDASDDERVRLVRAGELRPAPRSAATALVAPAAGRGEDPGSLGSGSSLRWRLRTLQGRGEAGSGCDQDRQRTGAKIG